MTTRAGGVRATAEWRRAAARARTRDGHCCVVCGRSKWDGIRLHVDHITRLRDGGDPYDLGNLQTLCEQCHRAKTLRENTTTGQHVRAQRQTTPPSQPHLAYTTTQAEPGGHVITAVPLPQQERSNDSAAAASQEASGGFLVASPLPQSSPSGLFPGGPVPAPPANPPRFSAPAHARAVASDAPHLAAVAARMGTPLRGWQQQVADRALERDSDGRLCWPVVVVLTPRQQGKSVLMRTLGMWWAMQGLTTIHVASNLAVAREVWSGAAVWAGEALNATVRRQHDQPEIVLDDCPNPQRPLAVGRYMVRAATRSAPTGFTADRGLIDEAWDVPLDVATQALIPTMSSVPESQLWLFSTAGESESLLLRHYRDAGLATIRGEHQKVCLMEWSAPDTAPWDDVATWQLATPHWDDARHTFMEQQQALIPESVFRSQYLNQWVTTSGGWMPPSTWDSARAPGRQMPEKPAAMACEALLDGTGFIAVTAGADAAGIIVTQVQVFTNISDLDACTRAFRGRVLVSPSFIGRLTWRPDLVGQRELDPAMRTVAGLMGQGLVTHPGDPRLDESMMSARGYVSRGGTQALGSTSGRGIEAARAWLWAVWAASAPARKGTTVRVHRPGATR